MTTMVDGQIDILYRDDSVIVVHKPGGLLAVPGRGPAKQDCVVNRVKRRLPHVIAQPAVHRLDLYTSGLMVLAVTSQAHRHLCRQFAAGRVDKQYIAVVEGEVAGESGEIALAFRLDPENRPRQVYDPLRGKLGVTRWQVMARCSGRTRLRLTPLTGRTHQLRLHCAHVLGLNAPIVGDFLYGSGRDGDPMLLHASSLAFHHPQTGRRYHFHLPPSF